MSFFKKKIYKNISFFQFKVNVHDVLSYLKSNKAFQEYDKYVTAYRVNQQTAPFLTENQNELSSDEVFLKKQKSNQILLISFYKSMLRDS